MEPLLNEREAAAFLKLALGTLRNWRSQGRGPEFSKFGISVRYDPQKLRDYVEARSRGAARGVKAA
jgi:hypothetical protein